MLVGRMNIQDVRWRGVALMERGGRSPASATLAGSAASPQKHLWHLNCGSKPYHATWRPACHSELHRVSRGDPMIFVAEGSELPSATRKITKWSFILPFRKDRRRRWISPICRSAICRSAECGRARFWASPCPRPSDEGSPFLQATSTQLEKRRCLDRTSHERLGSISCSFAARSSSPHRILGDLFR